MADPISIAGLVISAIGLVDWIRQYLSSHADAARCAKDLGAEVTAVGEALNLLRKHLQSNQGQAYERTSVLFCATNGCNQQLQRIQKTLAAVTSGRKRQQFFNTLRWPLDKDDTLKAVESLHRYTQVFHFALNVDGLSVLSASQVDASQKIQDILENMAATLSATHADTSRSIQEKLDNINSTQISMGQAQLQQILEALTALPVAAVGVTKLSQRLDQMELDEKKSTLLNALLPLSFHEKHLDLQMRRLEGLGQWFLIMPTFVGWREGILEKDTLWCHGLPGAGKTFLASVIIDHLQDRVIRTGGRVLYFYFDYRQQSQQTPFKILITLLRQLLSTYSGLPNAASELFKRIKEGQGLPNWNQLIDIFVNICTGNEETFLVFDALDECDADTNREAILDLLDLLVDKSQIRILITSRSYPSDIKEAFVEYPDITIEASDADVRAFLLEKIMKSRRTWIKRDIDEKLREEIIQELTSKSQGMFLLPALQISNILGQTNKFQVREALRTLPSGLEQNLDLIIKQIMSQDSQGNSKANLAIQTLMWLSNAKRPLKISELQHAIAISTETNSLAALTDESLFTECCLGLVTVDKETSIIRLVHLSINEYLQARNDSYFPRAHGIIATHCITYLSFKDHSIERCNSLELTLDGCLAIPFVKYAATFWGAHAAICYDMEVQSRTNEFLLNKDNVEFWFWIYSDANSYWSDVRDDDNSLCDSLGDNGEPFEGESVWPIHVAAIFGIEKLYSNELSSAASNPNVRDLLGRTPLILAAVHGQEAILQMLLLRDDVNLNATDKEGQTALCVSVKYNQISSVRLLVACPRVDVNIGDPLVKAIADYIWEDPPAQSGKGMAELLLAREDLEVNGQGEVAWEVASMQGDVQTLKALLARKDLQPWKHGTRLSLEDLCEYIRHTDYYTDGALVSVTRILIMLDQDHRFPFGDFLVLKGIWLVLYFAYCDDLPYEQLKPGEFCCKSDVAYIMDNSRGMLKDKLRASLDSHGISLDTTDHQGRTFLHFTAQHEKKEYVQFLLQHGLEVDAQDHSGRTPLHYAAEKGSEAISQTLLESGAAVNKSGNDGQTVLHYAVRSGNVSVVELLVSKSANLAVADEKGDSLLHTAALLEDSKPMALVLLSNNADINVLDRFGNTPLYHAALCGNAGMCKILLENNAATNTPGFSGTALNIAAQRMDSKVARELINFGADIDTIDCFGKSSRQWFQSYEPIARDLGIWKTNPVSNSPLQAREHIVESMGRRIKFLLSNKNMENYLIYRLGKQLLFLDDDESAAVAFSRGIASDNTSANIEFRYGCSICYSAIGPFQVCRICAEADLCSKCVQERPADDKVPWCSGHKFLEVPGKDWRDLPKGVVNKKGDTFEDWLRYLQKKYNLPI